jgi:hypothetical protein
LQQTGKLIIMKTIFGAALVAFATVAAVAPAQAAFVLANTNGGDGFVTLGAPGSFTLFSADNGVGAASTTFTNIASLSRLVTYNFVYTTNDRDGSDFDPAGYVVDGVFTQLSTSGLPNGGSNGGTVTFSVLAGQSYGFYVNATDSQLGRGNISVSAVPEAATWMLMISGFGMVGVAARRRTNAVAA